MTIKAAEGSMGIEIKRRDILKLAVLFAVASRIETGFAMDAAPRRNAPETNDNANVKTQPSSSDNQNAWAIEHHSNFQYIYGNAQTKDAFLLFLTNVYNIYPQDRFQRLIEEISQSGNSDKEIYSQIQRRLPEITPLLGAVRYALPALSKQKTEMTRQTLELLGATRHVNGYLELGTTGRYISRLRSEIELTGDVVLVNAVAPSYSPTDIAERGLPTKIGRFVSLNDYAPISSADVPDQSLDLVTNFIGFHHSPPEKRDSFVQSLARVLRPGGRMIVRDHDVDSEKINRMVALAHDVFNMGLGVDWSVNQQEIRNFTSLNALTAYLEGFGFKYSAHPQRQAGDPTQNCLIHFVRT